MKAYANWPTFPQFWVAGKLIGGLDVCNELDAEGELGPLLTNVRARSSALASFVLDRTWCASHDRPTRRPRRRSMRD